MEPKKPHLNPPRAAAARADAFADALVAADVPRARVFSLASPSGGDARLSQTPVGVDAGVDELNELSDPLGGAGAGKRVNTSAIELAVRK